MTTDGGSSPALDRLRAEINDKLSVAFFTAGHTSKVHQQIVLKQCEDYLVELFQTTVRELVPVPPQPDQDVETFDSVRQSITNAQTHISSEPPDLHGAMYSLQRALSTLRQKV